MVCRPLSPYCAVKINSLIFLLCINPTKANTVFVVVVVVVQTN